MKHSFLLLLVVLSLTSFKATNRITAKDINVLTGGEWKGSLTYLDYSSNKKTTIPANLVVERAAEQNTWYFKNLYPDEPKANGIDTIRLTAGGKTLDNETVVSRKDSAGIIKLITQKQLNDDGIIKIFRFTYIISPNKFSIKKEERKKTEATFFERNQYQFTR